MLRALDIASPSVAVRGGAKSAGSIGWSGTVVQGADASADSGSCHRTARPRKPDDDCPTIQKAAPAVSRMGAVTPPPRASMQEWTQHALSPSPCERRAVPDCITPHTLPVAGACAAVHSSHGHHNHRPVSVPPRAGHVPGQGGAWLVSRAGAASLPQQPGQLQSRALTPAAPPLPKARHGCVSGDPLGAAGPRQPEAAWSAAAQCGPERLLGAAVLQTGGYGAGVSAAMAVPCA